MNNDQFIKMFKHPNTGIIFVIEDEGVFTTWWTPDFFLVHRLEWLNASRDLQMILDELNAHYVNLQEVGNWKEWVLYTNRESETLYVTNRDDEVFYTETILAGDVPNGARLIDEAPAFFRLFLGDDAVEMKRRRRTLVLTP